MRKAWTWLLYRLGIRKPPPINELVMSTLANRADQIAENLRQNNALLRHYLRK